MSDDGDALYCEQLPFRYDVASIVVNIPFEGEFDLDACREIPGTYVAVENSVLKVRLPSGPGVLLVYRTGAVLIGVNTSVDLEQWCSYLSFVVAQAGGPSMDATAGPHMPKILADLRANFNRVVLDLQCGFHIDLAKFATSGDRQVQYNPEAFSGARVNLGHGRSLVVFETGRMHLLDWNWDVPTAQVLKILEKLPQYRMQPRRGVQLSADKFIHFREALPTKTQAIWDIDINDAIAGAFRSTHPCLKDARVEEWKHWKRQAMRHH